MSAAELAPAITGAATLLGVVVGSWLTARRDSRIARTKRDWEVKDRQRDERRSVYVRFLNAADCAVNEAWEVGRKRTSVRTLGEVQQDYLDWVAVRDEVKRVLTEVRLVAPPQVHAGAVEVMVCAFRFGEDALGAGSTNGMRLSPQEHQRAYDAAVTKLIEAMEADMV